MNARTTPTDGWLHDIEIVPSPNFDDRPEGTQPELIVIHAISLPPGQFGTGDIDRLFTNTLDPTCHPYFADIAGLRVSAHFLIRRNGATTQFVSCNARAWHAGASSWNRRQRCNDFSIGIELEGCDDLPFENAQYDKLITLIRALCLSYPIRALVGHADIAPQRKTDPGPCFEWNRLALASLPPRIVG